ncbi:recombinase family protein [Pseudomonas oryzihabitans]|uniref:recombinase family protein n=1 Tax=Pseudomonas oryzihabitans TaxID=47885 RepID=UPI002893E7E0|nr:recombinase family protein [Pseudomonas oryzihabitans]MDT3722849.1 recombinase family protein [Pseudomonas oryzihabitans]
MSRTFLYARVSTSDQTPLNQAIEVHAAGFAVAEHRVFSETISGSVAARERPVFQRLLDRLEKGDVLIVTKLDRLGRSALDVRSTVDLLASNGVRVHCLALGGVDLTSAAGKMTMQVVSAVAEFERDLLVERTQAGLARARRAGLLLGRPTKTSRETVQALKCEGMSQSEVALSLGVSLSTVKRRWQGLPSQSVSSSPDDARAGS